MPIFLPLLTSAAAQLARNDDLSEPMNTENKLGASMDAGVLIEARQTQRCLNPGWGRYLKEIQRKTEKIKRTSAERFLSQS